MWAGLDHVITCWLGDEHALREDEAHNAVGDSIKSLQVYRKYVELFGDPAMLAQYKAALMSYALPLPLLRRLPIKCTHVHVSTYASSHTLTYHAMVCNHVFCRRTPAPSFAKRNPSFEGVCMGNRKTCTCGAAFFS